MLAALFILAFGRSTAQEEFVAPPSSFITEFPFRMLTGGVIILKVSLGGYPDSLNFILDTGSGGISLDSSTVARMDIPNQPSDRTIRGIAGIRKVHFAYDHTLHLPGLAVRNLNFHINDYDLLTSVYGLKIDGIVGYSFLSRYIVHINYESMRIAVYTRGTVKYPRGGFLIKPILTSIPVVGATVRDERQISSRFYFDTGAGMCLLLSTEFIEDSALLRPKKKWYRSQAEGLGGKAAMRQGVIRQIKLGPYKFRNVPTYIFDDDYNITSYPYLGGLIGNDLLRRFNLILNYEKKDMYLVPNSHFREPFDYSYTGLGMYVIDGMIQVVDIMEGSPAEKAGLQPDDILVAVQNNLSRDIQVYKNLMQHPGQKVKLLVSRNGSLLELTMKVKSLMRR